MGEILSVVKAFLDVLMGEGGGGGREGTVPG